MAVPDVALTPAALTSPEDSPAVVMTDMPETAQSVRVSNAAQTLTSSILRCTKYY